MAESKFQSSIGQIGGPFVVFIFQGIGLNPLFQVCKPSFGCEGDITSRGYIPLILLLHVQLALGGRWMMLR